VLGGAILRDSNEYYLKKPEEQNEEGLKWSNSTEENVKHTEATQRGPSQIRQSIGAGKKMERNLIIKKTNVAKRGDEWKAVEFHVHKKKTTLGKYYKAAYNYGGVYKIQG
jgi:hypothetical protein